MASLVRIKNGYVVLYPERLFGETNVVGRWYKTQSKRLHGALLMHAPERTGRLKRSTKVDERRTGPKSRAISVRFGVKYAAYTDQGTRSPITAGGRLMPVGRSQGVSGKSRYVSFAPGAATRSRADYTYRRQVRGQARTNWVPEAVRSVPAFRGYRD